MRGDLRKILHIINGQYLSGPEHTVLNLAKGIDRKRYEFHIACLFDGPLVQSAHEQGLMVHVLPMRSRFDLSVFVPLTRLIAQENIDIVHTHSARANLVGRTAARLMKRPVVSHCHASPKRETTNPLHNWLLTFLDRLNARWVDMFITISDTLRAELVQDGVAPGRVTTVRTCVDLRDFDPTLDGKGVRTELGIPGTSPVAGMVALLRPRKGPDYFLRAAAQVVTCLPTAAFLLVGNMCNKAYGDYLQDLANQLSISSNVMFAGFRGDIPATLPAVDVLVIPSIFGEDVPLVLIEAMAMAKPVVASAIGGIPEVIRHEETGLLVQPRDVKNLATSMIQVLSDPDLACRMGASGRALAESEFSVARMAQQMEAVYERVLRH